MYVHARQRANISSESEKTATCGNLTKKLAVGAHLSHVLLGLSPLGRTMVCVRKGNTPDVAVVSRLQLWYKPLAHNTGSHTYMRAASVNATSCADSEPASIVLLY
ncbi:unnamed protein product, partial [Ectocarpus sp. 13 AM-2016]